MEDQTNNRIREEKLNTLKSMLWELGHTNKDAHHVIEYVDELLKSQRDSIVKRIEKAMPSHDAVQKELSLIKEE